MKAQFTMENGRRWSSDKVLHQKSNYPNLTLLTYTRAIKVSLFAFLLFAFLLYISERQTKNNFNY